MTTSPDCDVTFVVRAFDDEECVGHCLRRIAAYLHAHQLRAEILVADEGSGDNTVAVAVLMRSQLREIVIVHATPGAGLHDACQRARGRIVICADARTDAPLAALGYALGRLRDGCDVVALGGRYLVFRRTLAWRALPALLGRRDFVAVERRFVRRARALGLVCAVTKRPSRPVWRRLISALRPQTTL
jgi:glycosyltransferase involved in cell wall biosynthesis